MDALSVLQPGQTSGAQQQKALRALAAANQRGRQFGLVLSDGDRLALVRHWQETLQATGRIEFGPGVLPALADAFCDSPHIRPEEYADTLAALAESFYHFKNEAGEKLGDEELLQYMKEQFDGPCQGSMEHLNNTVLEKFAREARTGVVMQEEERGPDAETDGGK